MECPDCDMTGTAAGVRRHRASAHGHPTRAEFVDRFFDGRESGTAREVCSWLEVSHPEGNDPYRWSQRAVSADLAQHKNYPRRWDIRCDGFGPGARWVRVGAAQVPAELLVDPDGADDPGTIITRIESELRRLRALLTG